MARRYGTEPVNGQLLRSLMRQRGLFPDEIASQAHMSLRVVQKMMAGARCNLDFINRVASVLKVDSGLLIGGNAPHGAVNPSPFLQRTIQFSGFFEKYSPTLLLKISQEIAALLETYGIAVTAYQTQIALQEIVDQAARIVTLVYGRLENQRPFWCYVAVKPSRHKAFLEAQQAGKLNLREIEPFGEIIISGEDINSLQEVTPEVAKAYGCDPASFFQSIDTTAEVAMRVQAHITKDAREQQDFIRRHNDGLKS
jgi:hypothetical protein